MARQRLKVSNNFYLDEFVPQHLWLNNPDWMLLRLIDPRLFILHQFVRDRFGAMEVNNYYRGGARNWSGLRTKDSPHWSLFSDHSYGRAGDSKHDRPVSEIWEDIRKNYELLYKPLGLTSIEVGPAISWLHMGMGNFNSNKLYEIVIE